MRAPSCGFQAFTGSGFLGVGFSIVLLKQIETLWWRSRENISRSPIGVSCLLRGVDDPVFDHELLLLPSYPCITLVQQYSTSVVMRSPKPRWSFAY